MSNLYSKLCTVEVTIVKQDGTKSGPHRCVFSPDKVTIYDESLDVAEGDSVLRELPSGKVDTYTVLESHFSPGLYKIPAHFSLKTAKDTSLVPRHKTTTNNYHISQSQDFQIGDHNVQNFISSLGTLIGQIDALDAPEEEKQEAKNRLQSFLEHPLLCAILGGAAGGVSGMLSQPK